MTETVDFPQARIDELLAVVELTTGHHDDGKRACAMDLLGMAIQGEWTATPECVHPVLAQAVHKINDHRDTTTDDRRSLVVDAGPLLLGTVDKPAVWACLVRHKAGLTAAGLAAALAGTPETDLSYANLSFADLSYADLRYAKYSPLTRWPDGYDPAAHGAVSL